MENVLPEKVPVACEYAPSIPVPEKLRVAFGWGTVAIDKAGSGVATRFKWAGPVPASVRPAGEVFFRICAAIDIREEKRIEVALGISGKTIGMFDIRYGYVHQVFEISIPSSELPDVISEGLSLRMVAGEQPMWIFYHAASAEIPDTLQPHVLLDRGGNRLAEFGKQLKSRSSIQPFGWLEGCVLDGLFDMEAAFPRKGWRDAALAHLQLYFPSGTDLVADNHLGKVSDNRFYADEAVLPCAVIAQIWPDHPILDIAIEFCNTACNDLTAESCYTMAYPMAVLARLRNNADLARLAVRILCERISQLAEDKGLWQSYRPHSQAPRYYNWARGYAWYMLGMTRSLVQLRRANFYFPNVPIVEREIRRISALAMSYQRQDHLWSCYVDDPGTGVDTSGSAGIAAALAIGAENKMVADSAAASARRTFEALQRYLTPDGLLSGVAQNNRGGEQLQRNGYRVISQMAMGLMAQLSAVLGYDLD